MCLYFYYTPDWGFYLAVRRGGWLYWVYETFLPGTA